MGFSICRLEVSFYKEELKNPQLYIKIIETIFNANTSNNNNLIDYFCFYPSKIEDYYFSTFPFYIFEVLLEIFNGEKDYGRTIFLEELENNLINLKFIRFAN